MSYQHFGSIALIRKDNDGNDGIIPLEQAIEEVKNNTGKFSLKFVHGRQNDEFVFVLIITEN